jgi:hypothetical protein
MASIIVDDGVLTTRGGSTGNNTYHVGDGSVDWIYCTHTLSGSATKLDLILEVGQAGSAYFGNLVFAVSDIAAVDWFMERWGYYVMVIPTQRDVIATGSPASEFRHPMQMAGLIVDTELKCKTAPTGSAVIVDVNKDGNSAYSTRPQIAIAATTGDAAPDGTYQYRCLEEGNIVTMDVDQADSGSTADELDSVIKIWCPMPELELLTHG